MKKIILATTLLLCPLVHASNYVCNLPTNQGGKKIAVVSLSGDGTAAIQFGNKRAYGKYTEQHASCPSRNCGNFRIDIRTAVPNASYGEIGNVNAQITEQGVIQFSGISFYYVGGRVPNSYVVECSLNSLF